MVEAAHAKSTHQPVMSASILESQITLSKSLERSVTNRKTAKPSKHEDIKHGTSEIYSSLLVGALRAQLA